VRRRFPKAVLVLSCAILVAVACAKGVGRPHAETVSPRASRKEVIQSILRSNVRVAVVEGERPIRLASGVVLHAEKSGGSKAAWVMTNAHVAENVRKGEARWVEVWIGPEGREERHPAEVVALGRAPEVDLAVLKVEGLWAPAVRLADEDIEVGEDLVAVSAPYGRDLSVSTGIVSQFGRHPQEGWRLKTDAPIGYGASGGGLFRVSDGKLLALVEGYRTAKLSFPVGEGSVSFDVPMPGETFAAPAPKIRAFLHEQGLAHLLSDAATASR
jgi:S1-C subfamily serine protease